MRRGAFLLRKTSTTSADCPPIWSPNVPPFRATNVGRLQPVGVRQLARPKPTLPPIASPTCTTSGSAATQVALFKSDWGGAWSGSRTSSATISPARVARSASFALGRDCAKTAAGSSAKRVGKTTPSAMGREHGSDMGLPPGSTLNGGRSGIPVLFLHLAPFPTRKKGGLYRPPLPEQTAGSC